MQLLAVNYHYFREEKYENGIYPLTKREFLNQIDELSKYYEFISQNDLIDKIKNKKYSNKKYCLLTFDDGLKEQMNALYLFCLLYTSPSPRDRQKSRMPSSA
jgi:peptidoglycan/xylan/chitin deacetylase (PgdA/CDA1 family)